MCGIAGIFSLNGGPIRDAQSRISRMTAMLKHRGPDSQGIYVSQDGFLALGNTRLAIVDPLCPLKQPLETSDGKGVLSFNGEIYNYLDIKESLKQRGVFFETKMDTEVLLEGLRLEGEGLLNRLDGMWAFAYYDLAKRRLLLSRDILGERHIFYRIDKIKGELIFASEVKPILADAAQTFDIDFESLIASLRFFSAPPGRTLVKGIERLRPGHNISVYAGGDLKIYRYRRLHPEKWFDFFHKDPSLDDVIDLFEDTFHRACKRRLPLDVPFISTLSGGLDSSLVCVFASDLGTKRINTLYAESSGDPAGAGGRETEEYKASKFVSEKFSTYHKHIYMNTDECIPVLHSLAENGFDGTIDDGTASFEMLACHVRKEGLKVIMVCDGPDEFLGGYPIDQRAYFRDDIFLKKPWLYHGLRFISSTDGGRNILRSFGMDNYIVSPFTSYNPFRFRPIHESFGPEVLLKILPRELIIPTSEYYGVVDPVYKDILPELDYSQMRALAYTSSSLPDHFNLRTDKAFLHASVESRLPYQAPEMVELLLAMPAHLRFNEGKTTKYLMRKIVERRIDPRIAYRPKRGFSAPLFRSPNVYKRMNFEEVIRTTPLFNDFPFRRGTRESILKPEYKKLLWPFFVLAKTYDCLRRGVYD